MVALEKFPNVTLVKFNDLDEIDRSLFENAISHFFGKVGPDAKLQLSLKEYKKGGLKAQHEIHGSLKVDGKSFFAEHKDWQLLGTIQNVLKKLEKEVLKEGSKKK
jgi:ribosome-associated translation inhibitor RaiA